MKCQTHPTEIAVANCSVCNSPLCEECDVSTETDNAICSRCIALAAVSDFVEAEADREKLFQEHEEAKKEKGKRVVIVQYAIIVLALIILPIQLLTTLQVPEPVPLDLSDPDEVTDQCILNLFIISDMLQLGELPDNDFKCPASDDAYIVIQTAEDIIVRDPHPELHGFTAMSVSRNNPFPQIVN